MNPMRFSSAIHLLIRAAADLDELRPAFTPRALRHLLTAAKRRRELAGSVERSVSLIDEAVGELRALWVEEEAL